MIEDRLVQNRDCPKCGVAQTRRASASGVFRRWTRCDCPPKTKSKSEPENLDSGVSNPSSVSGYLHRANVTPIPKSGKK